MSSNRRRLTVPVVLVGLFACSADEPSTSETTQGLASSNRIAVNRIAINRIAINSITTKELLDSPDCSPATEPNCGGRDVLEYLVGCAFPSDVTIVGTSSNGTTYEFQGNVGLAPKWELRALTGRERRWISACMLARVNNTGKSLFISLRGPHPALTVSQDEVDEYNLEEGAFYGDIFAREQTFYACRGADLYAGNFGDALALRACAQPTAAGDKTLCGMTYAGECGAFAADRACETKTGDYYEECHTRPIKVANDDDDCENDSDSDSDSDASRSRDNDSDSDSDSDGDLGGRGGKHRYDEVITVWVQKHPVVVP